MPVYVRKNLMSITPDTLSNLSSDEDDYLTDPDQMFDKLPQPYRLVDKILNRVFDVAWDLISSREAAAEELRSREPVPEHEFTAIVRENEDTLCLSGSSDGSVLFLGLPNGLAVVHATLYSAITSWEEEGASIKTLDNTQIGVQMCLIASLDTKGVCRLFCFSGAALLILKTFDAEIPSGAEVVDMHLSKDGDYIALTLEKADKEGDRETWVDVFKLPRDNWIRDVEAALAKQQQQQQHDVGLVKSTEDLTKNQEVGGEGAVNDTIEYSHPMEGLSMPNAANTKSVNSQDTPRTTTPSAMAAAPVSAPDWNPANLSKPTTVLRVRPLPDRLTACTSVPHPGPATAASEDWLSTIGQGNKHLIQTEHLNTRRLVADQMLGPYADQKYATTEKIPCRAQCLFVRPGMMLPSASSQDQAHILALTWSNSTNICLYNLLKNAKDLEHKPDQVWPHAGKVTAMTTTSCTSLVALGLQDGTVILWDKHLSVPIMTHKVFTRAIKHLHILPPPPPLPTSSSAERLLALQARPEVSILVGDSSSDLVTVCCCYGDSKPTERQVYRGTWRDKRDGASLVTPISTVKDTALVVTRFGEVFLCNVMNGKKVCLFKLPPDTILSGHSGRPIIEVSATGQTLFFRGERSSKTSKEAEDSEKDVEEGEAKPVCETWPTVYAYAMHTFPCLTNLWRPLEECEWKAPTLMHITQAKARFDVLFSNRLNEQQRRQVRMQERWGALKQKAANRER